MIVFTNNWRIWMAGTAASLAIFLVVFFTTIQPSMNTADQAVKTGLQQSQQALNQAQKQISSAPATVGGAAGGAATITKQAKKALGNAAKLTSCVAAAGTDPTKMAACQTKYSG
jgi:F0F1-type ATP synthase membrane subunit b/b'